MRILSCGLVSSSCPLDLPPRKSRHAFEPPALTEHWRRCGDAIYWNAKRAVQPHPGQQDSLATRPRPYFDGTASLGPCNEREGNGFPLPPKKFEARKQAIGGLFAAPGPIVSTLWRGRGIHGKSR